MILKIGQLKFENQREKLGLDVGTDQWDRVGGWLQRRYIDKPLQDLSVSYVCIYCNKMLVLNKKNFVPDQHKSSIIFEF